MLEIRQQLQKDTDIPLNPAAPCLLATGTGALWLSPEGEIEEISAKEVALRVMTQRPVLCHARRTAQQLGLREIYAYDVLELYAFVHPTRFCTPTVEGLSTGLHLTPPKTPDEQAIALLSITTQLLQDMQEQAEREKSDPATIAWMMGLGDIVGETGNITGGWPWAPFVLNALNANHQTFDRNLLKIWNRLPEWSETAPPPPPGHKPITEQNIRDRLAVFLDSAQSEHRPQQESYATALVDVFQPAEHKDSPHIALAEAGTGVGKTVGYLAPATVWAEKNDAAVWISTYTKNLQRQIDDEMARLYPDQALREHKVVLRKGRENYLCLLNLEDATQSPAIKNNGVNATAVGLMLRWAAATRDGDMTGGDFPGWLPGVIGYNRTVTLADKRGECIYTACPHYHKCFIERSIRRAKHADIVVANHALVMSQTALASADDELPARYIFDEGHHLFEAADSAFATHLTGSETTELRRWILGREDRIGRNRSRGLQRRTEDLITDNQAAVKCVQDIVEAARALPGVGWQNRLQNGNPKGITERFLGYVRQQVFARAQYADGIYSIECETQPVLDGMMDVVRALKARLTDLGEPMKKLTKILQEKLNDEADTLNPDTRRRLQAVIGSLQRREAVVLSGWLRMLNSLSKETPPECVDWFGLDRQDGRDVDVGLYRHWIDPTALFAASITPHAQGIGITSASLRDTSGDTEQDWRAAEARTGAAHFSAHGSSLKRIYVPSPFNYAEQTKILVITDVQKNDSKQVAAAYRELFKASGGGALGLFTAIHRLKDVQKIIKDPLQDSGLALLAQHCDGLEVTTLIDIFRMDKHACLLGTDATRDGIDVPGQALRLVAYDRVPWPRPSLLHKARRKKFGVQNYDDMLTRFRLKQAYGRLIRKENDKGVFVMLDSGLPSRLCSAFPQGVDVQRLGLSSACEEIKTFLK